MTAPKRTGRAVNAIQPSFDVGVVGVDVPDNVSYLLNLDKGTNARAMVNLAGKVIPIRGADGTMEFRKVGANSIGKIPIITRSAKDGSITDGRPQWVQAAKPGINFIYEAIFKSIKEWERSLKPDDIVKILRQTELRDSIERIFGMGI